MSNKPKLKVFSFYMCFVFVVLLGAQYIPLNILARFAIIRFGRRKLQIKKDMVEKYLNPKAFFNFYRLISK